MKEVINKQEVVKVYINEKSDNFHFEEKVNFNRRTKTELYGMSTDRAGLTTAALDPKGTYVVAINNQRANNEPLNGKNGTQTGKNASATFFHEVLDEGLNHHINKGSESNPVKYQNAALENLNLSPRDASDHIK